MRVIRWKNSATGVESLNITATGIYFPVGKTDSSFKLKLSMAAGGQTASVDTVRDSSGSRTGYGAMNVSGTTETKLGAVVSFATGIIVTAISGTLNAILDDEIPVTNFPEMGLGRFPAKEDADAYVYGATVPQGLPAIISGTQYTYGGAGVGWGSDKQTGVTVWTGCPMIPCGHQQNGRAVVAKTATSLMNREWFIVKPGCTSVQFVYANENTTGDIVVTCALEYPVGTYKKLYFEDGGESITLKPGQVTRTRPAQVYIKKIPNISLVAPTDFAYIRTYVTCAAGSVACRSANDAGDLYVGVSDSYRVNGGVDQTLTDNASMITTRSYIYSPLAILASNKAYAGRVFGILGDSIASGEDDTFLYRGWAQVALSKTDYPYLRDTRSGALIHSFTSMSSTQPMYPEGIARLEGCTDVIVQVGTNSITSDASYDSNIEAYTNLVAAIKMLGAKRIYLATIPPRTTSTDGWATEMNQTPFAGNGPGPTSARSKLNSDIRNLAYGHTGYIEVADLVETGRDTALWKPGMAYTSDGTHLLVAANNLVGLAAVSAIS